MKKERWDGERILLLKIINAIFCIRTKYSINILYKAIYIIRPFLRPFDGTQLVTGSLIIVWLTSIIDNKGIGNGTSIIIFTNIVQTLVGKNVFKFINFDFSSLLEILVLLILLALISISQTARFNIEIVSARQLTFLERQKAKIKILIITMRVE